MVLSTRDKNTTNGRREGEKENSLLHSELNPEDQRKCLVCDDCKQKLFRVVGSSHSVVLIGEAYFAQLFSAK